MSNHEEKKQEKKQQKKLFTVDFVHPALMSEQSVKTTLEEVSDVARRRPQRVVFPVVLTKGATFESAVLGSSPYSKFGDLNDWLESARKFSQDISVFLSIGLTLDFVENSRAKVSDQFDDPGKSVCLNNPMNQSFLSAILGEIVDTFRPAGVVFDPTDIYLTSNTAGQETMNSYCFCTYCQRAVREKIEGKFRSLIPDIFRETANPLALFLRPLPSQGVKGMALNTRWSPKRLLQQSESERILDFSRPSLADLTQDDLLHWATFLLAYTKARATVTAEALTVITNTIRAKNVLSAIFVETPHYITDSTIELRSLSQAKGFDEYWISDIPGGYELHQGLACHWYAYQKGRYTLKAFFELLDAFDRLATMDAATSIRVLEERLNRCRLANINMPMGLRQTDYDDTFIGSVFAPFNEVIGQIVERQREDYAAVMAEQAHKLKQSLSWAMMMEELMRHRDRFDITEGDVSSKSLGPSIDPSERQFP